MAVPFLSVAQMREWENRTWAAGVKEEEVIARVGKALADLINNVTEPGVRILILAGKGHNGDDARAAIPHIVNREVSCLNVVDPAVALRQIDSMLDSPPDVLVDGLFGIGLSRPLSEDWCRLIERINGLGSYVIAVDLPSGLHPDTGDNFGAVIRADTTLTVGAPKIGFLRKSAWPFVGKLEVAQDVGLIPCPFASETYLITRDDIRGIPPRRVSATHKGNYGHLAIIAGSRGYHGAAVLAAQGAQRAQPGLITVFTQENVYVPIAAQLRSAMVQPLVPTEFEIRDFTGVLIGPGLAARDISPAVISLVRRIWRDADVPVIVDASALDWLVSEPVPSKAVRVVTPHPGEAARMLRATVDYVLGDRVAALREISSKYGGTWVVLKGYLSLIGRASGPIYVSNRGNPHLAQGGAGDVLAGYISGLLAQPRLQQRVEEVLRFAVWQHGAAADHLTQIATNWTIEELVEVIGQIRPR